jgi:hypothetical protein
MTPVGAIAASPQATDPSADSPAGVTYAIPLDSARQDAAPHAHVAPSGGSGGGSSGSGGGLTGGGSGGSGGGVAGGGSGGSGGGGSGSSGGGVAGGGSGGSGGGSASGSAGGSGSGSGGGSASGSAGSNGSSASLSGRGAGGSTAAVLIPGGQPGSLVHSANGFGSSSLVPGLSAPASAGFGAVQSDASSAPVLAFILALIVLSVGGFCGSRAWRAQRRTKAAASGAPEDPAHV